jgi:hypothetical protein
VLSLLFTRQDMVALACHADGEPAYSGSHVDDADLLTFPVGLTTYLQVTDYSGLTSTFHNSGEEESAELNVNHPTFKSSGSKLFWRLVVFWTMLSRLFSLLFDGLTIEACAP